MEADDLFLVIVGEDDKKSLDLRHIDNFKEYDENTVEIKTEKPEEDFETEYLEDTLFLEVKYIHFNFTSTYKLSRRTY